MTDPLTSNDPGLIESRVQRVLSEVFNVEPSAIGPDTSTDTLEEWDSLQQLSVVLALEEEFQIHFGDEDTAALVSFPLIVEILREHLATPNSGA